MKRKGVFRALNIIKNIICWTLIACLVSLVIIFLISRVSGETPSIFGYSIYRVSSGSMEPELMVGDVILDKAVDDPESLKVGDVVTFEGGGELSGMTVTHKIIKAPYNDGGTLMVQTKGVANEVADSPVSVKNVKAVMVMKLPVFDVVYNVFLSPWGLLILIALIVLVFMDEIVTIVKILTGNDKTAEDAEDINSIIDRLQGGDSSEKVRKNEKADENEDL